MFTIERLDDRLEMGLLDSIVNIVNTVANCFRPRPRPRLCLRFPLVGRICFPF